VRDGIKCFAPIFDLSGYGSWSRTYLNMFIDSGIPLTIGTDINNKNSFISYDPVRADYGDVYSKLNSKLNLDVKYSTTISWLTPDCAALQNCNEKQDTYKILMTLWETSKLPDHWIPMIDLFNEVWLPGPWNREIFERSLFNFSKRFTGYSSLNKKIIRELPLPVKDTSSISSLEEGQLKISRDKFNFYTISQWSERKNFFDLILTYLSTFSSEDNVRLILKTHLKDFTEEDRKYIVNEIGQIIQSTGRHNLPEISLIHKSLSSAEIQHLHNNADCYVSCSRGEGLGLGVLEACTNAKPVISHEFGEQSMYLKGNSLCYDYQLGPVNGRSNPTLYKSDQEWAYPIYRSLKEKLLYAYNNKAKISEEASVRKLDILNSYNTENIKDLLGSYL
jgi:glycosyltransferase involved in cell wall biosynthesis